MVPSLATILTAILFYLKLTGQLAWSWPWVFAPLWLPFALVIGAFIIAGACAFVALLVTEAIGKFD